MTFEGRTVAVLGLGLIGGSLARDLAALCARILGYDTNPAALDAAVAEGVVERLDETWAGLAAADVVIVAVPVSATPNVLALAASCASRATLIMDVGSTKRGAMSAAESLGIGRRFVGAHPMTGDHRAGWSASRSGMFAGARVYLCHSLDASTEAVGQARATWTSLGADPRLIDAETHDTLVGFSSHLPHVASAALALAMSGQVTPGDLGPGGRDVLRLAASAPDLWTAIAMENTSAILRALDALGAELEGFRTAIETRNEEQLRAAFASARDWSVGSASQVPLDSAPST